MLERSHRVLLVLLALSPAASCDPSPQSHARGDGWPTEAPHRDSSPADHDARPSEASAARDLAPPLADPTAPLPLGPEDWSIAEIVADADHPGMYTGVIEISAGSPAATATEVFWSDWTSKVQEPPFPTVPLGGRRWRMRSFSPGDPWHVRSPGETLRDIAVRYALVEGGPVSGNSLDRKAFTAPANDFDGGSQPQPDAGSQPQPDAGSQPQLDAGSQRLDAGSFPGGLALLSTATVNKAIKSGLFSTKNTGTYAGSRTPMSHGPTPVVLALRVLAGGAPAAVVKQLKAQIDWSLDGDKCLLALTGYTAQHDLNHVGMFAVVRNIPSIWNDSSFMTVTKKKKITALMQAAAVGGAWASSDSNPRTLASKSIWDLAGYSAYRRTWGPNFRLAMVGTLLASIPFFQGPSALQSFLKGYDHNALEATLKQLGLTNTYKVWSKVGAGGNAPTVAQVHQAVRTYAYHGNKLSSIFPIVKLEAANMWNRTISGGYKGVGVVYDGVRRGFIVKTSGAIPNAGDKAMANELDTKDGGAPCNGNKSAPRSAMSYAVDGARTELIYLSVLAATGYLTSKTSGMSALMTRAAKGWNDLKDKTARGFRSTAKGNCAPGGRENWIAPVPEAKYNFSMATELFEDFVVPMLNPS